MTSALDHSLDRIGSFRETTKLLRRWWETIRRAFVEFLKPPTLVSLDS
jgi:hypothetical protein